MAITKVYLVPLIFSVLMPCAFFATYMIAVNLGHVPAIFPYISDTGTFPPESCYFSQSMNVMALLNFIFTWVRFSHVQTKCSMDIGYSFVLRINRLSYWCGVVASIGISIVGNFQETNIPIMHILGAVMLFFPGLAYVWMHAFISIRTTSVLGSRLSALSRIVLGFLGTIALVIGIVGMVIAFMNFKGDDIIQWKPHDGGFVFHLISTASEWIFCLGYSVFIFTFFGEFKEIKIGPPEIQVKARMAEEDQLNGLRTSD